VGDPLLTLVDTDTLELSATLPSDMLGALAPGSPIRFHIEAYPGQVWSGRVDRIAPVTEPGTRQVRLYTRFPNPDGRLVGGLFVSGSVITDRREAAVAIPAGALRPEGGAQVVYRVKDGRVQRVEVETGLADESRGSVEIRSGVSVGDSLLTGLLPGLRDGIAVRITAGS
jgi:RND family efflux transporter MFP subunit